jgi:hypothetical protein
MSNMGFGSESPTNGQLLLVSEAIWPSAIKDVGAESAISSGGIHGLTTLVSHSKSFINGFPLFQPGRVGGGNHT